MNIIQYQRVRVRVKEAGVRVMDEFVPKGDSAMSIR